MVVASLRSLPDLPSQDFADLIEARINQSNATVVVEAPAASQAALSFSGSGLTPVGNNVVAFAKPRPGLIALAAVAAIMLFGLVAHFSLTPQGPVEVAQTPKTAPGPLQKLESDKNSVPMTDDIVALYDEEGSGNGSDVGISTNEDGLYAIKL
jgi:hypothetical protein